MADQYDAGPQYHPDVWAAYEKTVGTVGKPNQPLAYSLIDPDSCPDREQLWRDLWTSFQGLSIPLSRMLLRDVSKFGGPLLNILPIMTVAEAREKYTLEQIGNKFHMDYWIYEPSVLDYKSQRMPGMITNSQRYSRSMTMELHGECIVKPMDFPTDKTKLGDFVSETRRVSASINLTWQYRMLEQLVYEGNEARYKRVEERAFPAEKSDFEERLKEEQSRTFALQKDGTHIKGVESSAYQAGLERLVEFDTMVLPHGSLKHINQTHPYVSEFWRSGRPYDQKINLDTQGTARSPVYGLTIMESRRYRMQKLGGKMVDPLVHAKTISQRFIMVVPNIGRESWLKYETSEMTLTIADAKRGKDVQITADTAFENAGLFHSYGDHGGGIGGLDDDDNDGSGGGGVSNDFGNAFVPIYGGKQKSKTAGSNGNDPFKGLNVGLIAQNQGLIEAWVEKLSHNPRTYQDLVKLRDEQRSNRGRMTRAPVNPFDQRIGAGKRANYLARTGGAAQRAMSLAASNQPFNLDDAINGRGLNPSAPGKTGLLGKRTGGPSGSSSSSSDLGLSDVSEFGFGAKNLSAVLLKRHLNQVLVPVESKIHWSAANGADGDMNTGPKLVNPTDPVDRIHTYTMTAESVRNKDNDPYRRFVKLINRVRDQVRTGVYTWSESQLSHLMSRTRICEELGEIDIIKPTNATTRALLDRCDPSGLAIGLMNAAWHAALDVIMESRRMGLDTTTAPPPTIARMGELNRELKNWLALFDETEALRSGPLSEFQQAIKKLRDDQLDDINAVVMATKIALQLLTTGRLAAGDPFLGTEALNINIVLQTELDAEASARDTTVQTDQGVRQDWAQKYASITTVLGIPANRLVNPVSFATASAQDKSRYMSWLQLICQEATNSVASLGLYNYLVFRNFVHRIVYKGWNNDKPFESLIRSLWPLAVDQQVVLIVQNQSVFTNTEDRNAINNQLREASTKRSGAGWTTTEGDDESDATGISSSSVTEGEKYPQRVDPVVVRAFLFSILPDYNLFKFMFKRSLPSLLGFFIPRPYVRVSVGLALFVVSGEKTGCRATERNDVLVGREINTFTVTFRIDFKAAIIVADSENIEVVQGVYGVRLNGGAGTDFFHPDRDLVSFTKQSMLNRDLFSLVVQPSWDPVEWYTDLHGLCHPDMVAPDQSSNELQYMSALEYSTLWKWQRGFHPLSIRNFSYNFDESIRHSLCVQSYQRQGIDNKIETNGHCPFGEKYTASEFGHLRSGSEYTGWGLTGSRAAVAIRNV